ncbi:hypothetical protein AAHB47_30435 [Bacillus wiedmannii]
MGISDRIWGAVVALGIATNIVACIMAVYIQKYELMINYLTNILFLIIIAITYIKTEETCMLNMMDIHRAPLLQVIKSLILAEFNYEHEPQETFPFNQAKERYSMFLLKRYMLPYMYWNFMLKGIL